MLLPSSAGNPTSWMSASRKWRYASAFPAELASATDPFLATGAPPSAALHDRRPASLAPGRRAPTGSDGARGARLSGRDADPHRGRDPAPGVDSPGAGRRGARRPRPRRSRRPGRDGRRVRPRPVPGAAHAPPRPHGPAPAGRRRQRLRGRDHAPSPPLAGEDDGPAGGRGGGPAPRRRAGGARRVGRASLRGGAAGLPGRRSRRSAKAWRSTAGTGSRAPTAARRSSGSSTPRTRPTTAPSSPTR